MQRHPDDQWITIGNRRLRIRFFKPSSAAGLAPILLLHEGLGSITQWRAFPEALAIATGRAVIGYDRYGHGGSERLAGPRPADFLAREADATRDVLDTLGFGSAIVFGHSDGGTIALLAAAAHPDRIDAVISEAAHVFSETESATGFSSVLDAYDNGGLRERLQRHHGDNVDAMFHGWADVWRSPAMRSWSMIERLPAIRCPVLVLQGDQDDHGSLAQTEAISRGVAGSVATSILAGAGHAPHIDAMDQVVALVVSFLSRAAPESLNRTAS